jgi:hypothetical protein
MEAPEHTSQPTALANVQAISLSVTSRYSTLIHSDLFCSLTLYFSPVAQVPMEAPEHVSQPTALVNVHAFVEAAAGKGSGGAPQFEYLHTVRLQQGLATCLAVATASPLAAQGTKVRSMHLKSTCIRCVFNSERRPKMCVTNTSKVVLH